MKERKHLIPSQVLSMAFLLLTTFVFGQTEITGKVVSEDTGNPLEFATVELLGYSTGAITDKNGEFLISVEKELPEKQKIRISSIGYYSKEIAIEDCPLGDIRLKTSYNFLDAITISAIDHRQIDAEKIVKNGLKKLKKQSPGFLAYGFYKHRKIENGKIKQIVQGEVKFIDPKGYGKPLKNKYPHIETIEFLDRRASLDYSIDHITSYNTLEDFDDVPFVFLLKNGLKYDRFTTGYVYHFGDTLISDNKITTRIFATHVDTVSLRNSVDHYDKVYHFTLDPQNLTESFISKFELHFKGSLRTKAFKQTKGSQFSIELEQAQSSILPKKITHSILQSREVQGEQSSVLSHIDEFVFGETTLNWRKPEVIEFKPASDESEINMTSERISSEIISLEDEVALDPVARIEYQEKLELTLINSIIKSNYGKKDTYIIIWDSHVPLIPYSKMFFDLESREDREFIFIGTVKNYLNWKFILNGDPLEAFKNFYLPEMYVSIISEECFSEGAIHLKIDKNGNKHCQDTPFSLEELNGTN